MTHRSHPNLYYQGKSDVLSCKSEDVSVGTIILILIIVVVIMIIIMVIIVVLISSIVVISMCK